MKEWQEVSQSKAHLTVSLRLSCATCTTVPNIAQTHPRRAMMNEVQKDEMSTTQERMEKQFFIHFISLIDEVQGKSKLPSQLHSNRKSSWVKQTKNPKQKKDALSQV